MFFPIALVQSLHRAYSKNLDASRVEVLHLRYPSMENRYLKKSCHKVIRNLPVLAIFSY